MFGRRVSASNQAISAVAGRATSGLSPRAIAVRQHPKYEADGAAVDLSRAVAVGNCTPAFFQAQAAKSEHHFGRLAARAVRRAGAPDGAQVVAIGVGRFGAVPNWVSAMVTMRSDWLDPPRVASLGTGKESAFPMARAKSLPTRPRLRQPRRGSRTGGIPRPDGATSLRPPQVSRSQGGGWMAGALPTPATPDCHVGTFMCQLIGGDRTEPPDERPTRGRFMASGRSQADPAEPVATMSTTRQREQQATYPLERPEAVGGLIGGAPIKHAGRGTATH